MKTSHGIASALLAGLGFVGCNGANTVTGVDSRSGGTRFAESPQKVASPPASLSGMWSGTIKLHAYLGAEHGNVVLPCGGIASILIYLSQDGQRLTGQFQSGCAGMLEIHGVVVGDRISGTLDSARGQDYGKIYGTVSASQIAFWTMLYIDEHGDGTPDTDGDGSVRSSDVELHRSMPSERETPIRVASGRSPRVLAPRR
jgi:hypothetical protein